MESLRVVDYMLHHPLLLHRDTPLSVAVESLFEHGVKGAPVIDEETRLLGFVSEKDCLAIMLKSSYHCDFTATVADVMRTNILSVTPDTSVLTLAERILGNKPKIYPVIDSGKVVGIIDLSLILKAINGHLKECFRHAV